jgi:hypothetical protein
MSLKRLLTICFFLMFFHFVFPSFAYAYLDPGSGSYIFQLILAGIVGLMFLIKVYWNKIKALVVGLFSRDRTDADLPSNK